MFLYATAFIWSLSPRSCKCFWARDEWPNSRQYIILTFWPQATCTLPSLHGEPLHLSDLSVMCHLDYQPSR